jgi:hypothetical protein
MVERERDVGWKGQTRYQWKIEDAVQRERRFWIGIPISILKSQLSVPLLLIGCLD